MLARACATEMAKMFGRSVVESGFIYVKGPELLHKWLGETEANIRKVFAAAREHMELAGYPAILFIDEADALLGQRGSMHPGFEGIERTIVPQFLSEMDGMHESHVFVLLSTNRPEILDAAVIRNKRINRKVHVKRPTRADALDIFTKLMSKRPCVSGLPTYAVDELYAEEHHLWNVTTDKKTTVPIFLKTLASGAMIADLVDHAAQWAIREKATEVTEEHMRRAIADIEEEQKRLAHDLSDFRDALDGEIVSVEKVKDAA
jgi:proteasome-associated ATPase